MRVAHRAGCPTLIVPVFGTIGWAKCKLPRVHNKPQRFHQAGCAHFITFSCYRRQQFLASPEAKRVFERTLERVRKWYGLGVVGYVVMPEHVHLLVTEPERKDLSIAIQMLKQIVARASRRERFWQVRYYDFPVWSQKKCIEKLRYIHRNPVRRGLVTKAEDWEWSSFRHYATGCESMIEIESKWTARERERLESAPTLSLRDKGGATSR